MNRVIVVFVCLVLCLGGTSLPAVSAATLVTSTRTTLNLCLQQEYLMRDTYQIISHRYPSLTAFAVVAADEVAMIETLVRVFAKCTIPLPPDMKVIAAQATAAKATSAVNADILAIELEKSTASLMTRLIQTTRSTDVARVLELIRAKSLYSHISAFSAEQAIIVAPASPATAIRPFPAPITTRTVLVPTSIDASGATDVSAALNGFVATVPDGSIIAFPIGAVYRLDQGIQIANRHNLVFAGNGTTLKVGPNGRADDQLASSFVVGHRYGKWWQGGNSDIVIHDFILIGNDPSPGMFTIGQEGQANLDITGVDRIEIYNVTGSAAPGDFVFINGVNGAWIHDCHAITVGRTGGTIISGRDITFEDNAFGIVGYCVFNIEPNTAAEATYNARFLTNTAYSWECAFLSVEGGHTGAAIDGVVADGNIVTGHSIRTVIDNGATARMKNITFTNNIGKRADDGPVLVFAHIDNLMVVGNIQPLSSGSLMKIINSTGWK